ncbi:hypothetical protein E4U42_002620 [Claviceps africana]|uniref:Zinc/cadmium resistance protein n=1 Tax=Claviceps africana TaxID=83212 RepID=A0A8K0JCQ8_9HYPO|nr:hypothetical protein E4U42_002620 [Claviceps africana]
MVATDQYPGRFQKDRNRRLRSTQIEQPKIVFIVGCVGLGLNLLVMSFLHEHNHDHDTESTHGHSHVQTHSHGENVHEKGLKWDVEAVLPFPGATQGNVEARKHLVASSHRGHKHAAVTPAKPERDLGLLGVFVHVVGDAINNVGVIIAALVIWLTDSPTRYYADPAIGVFIAIMIFLTALPLTKRSGSILLQVAPPGVQVEDVKHDIAMIDGVHSVHELHIWRLNQQKSIATAHIVVDDRIVNNFAETASVITECLHAYGIHSVTLQPETNPLVAALMDTASSSTDGETTTIRADHINLSASPLLCDSACSDTRCCI